MEGNPISDRETALSKGGSHLFRRLLETISEGAVALNHEGRVLYCNRQAATLLGLLPAQVLDSYFAAFVPAEERPLFIQFLAQSVREPSWLELHLNGGLDHPTLVQLSSSPLELEDSSGIGLVISDLSERRSNEEALREALKRYQVATESIRDAFILVEAETPHHLVESRGGEDLRLHPG